MSFATATTAASQVVLHPLVSRNLKILSTTVGRDKIYRLVQNFARAFAWVLLLRGKKIEAARWNALKSHLALGRKLLRLAKPLEHLQAALRGLQAPTAEKSEQFLSVARQLCYFFYLTYDAFVWANTIKFFNLQPSTAQRVNKIANRYWLAGILLSIAHGVIKASRLGAESKRLKSIRGEKSVGDEAERETKIAQLEAARTANRTQFAMDCLDAWLPAAAIGLVNVNDGVLGAFGMTTSFIALRSQWAALYPNKSQ